MTEAFSPSCPFCREEGRTACLFSTQAKTIADDPDLTPEFKQGAIAEFRKEARDHMCPHLNDVHPFYEGMRDL